MWSHLLRYTWAQNANVLYLVSEWYYTCMDIVIGKLDSCLSSDQECTVSIYSYVGTGTEGRVELVWSTRVSFMCCGGVLYIKSC